MMGEYHGYHTTRQHNGKEKGVILTTTEIDNVGGGIDELSI